MSTVFVIENMICGPVRSGWGIKQFIRALLKLRPENDKHGMIV